MTNPSMLALKVGVRAVMSDRQAQHEARGWALVQEWYFDLGYDALDCEELVLDRWLNLYSGNSQVRRIDMPQGGSTETTKDSTDTRADTIQFIESLIFALAERECETPEDSLRRFTIRPGQDPAAEEWKHDDGWPSLE